MRQDLWGMRMVTDLQQKYRHKLVLGSPEEESSVWVVELTHRHGAPVIRIETWNLASAFDTLLRAAEHDGFWDELAEYEKDF